MSRYYRLIIAIAAAVALGAMAALGGGDAEAHGPDHNWRYYLNAAGVCVADGHTHDGQDVGRQVIGMKASDPTRCATPTPTPTPTPVVERDMPDDPIIGVAQVWQCQPRGDEPCAFRVLAHDGYHLAP